MVQTKLKKFTIFWFLPFLAGGFISTGYLLTHKIIHINSNNNILEQYSPKKNREVPNSNKEVIKTSLGDNPNQIIHSEEPAKTLSIKKIEAILDVQTTAVRNPILFLHRHR